MESARVHAAITASLHGSGGPHRVEVDCHAFKNIVGDPSSRADVVTPNFANNSAVVREGGRGGRRRAGGHGDKIGAALEAAGVELTNGKQRQTKRPPLPTFCGSSIVLM